MPTLEVYTGSESWSNHSAKMMVFYVDPSQSCSETPLKTYVDNLPDTGRTLNILNKSVIHARPGMRVELGMWYRTNYDIASGTLLKVFGQRHMHQGAANDKACAFIRVRTEAAHRHLTMRLSRDTVGALPAVYVNGRFDVLTLEDVEREFAIQVPAHFRSMYDSLYVNRLFGDHIISAEQEPQAMQTRLRVRDDRDQEVTILRTRRRRAMEL